MFLFKRGKISTCVLWVTSISFESPHFLKASCSFKNAPNVGVYVENTLRVALQTYYHSNLTAASTAVQLRRMTHFCTSIGSLNWRFSSHTAGPAPHTALWQSVSSLKFWSHGWSHIQDKSLPCEVELLHSEVLLLDPVRELALTCPKILVKAKASFFWRILYWWRWIRA